MSEKVKQIAQRIKTLREIAGTSPEALAKELKVSVEQYKHYESGAVDIPVSFLYAVAHKFKIELTALITGEEPRLHLYSLVRSGKGLAVERRKEYNYQDLAYNFIRKRGEIFLVTVEPTSPRVKPHVYSHAGQEFTYVLEGSLRLVLNGHDIILKEGDSLFFDSGYDHAMVALDHKPAKFLAVIF